MRTAFGTVALARLLRLVQERTFKQWATTPTRHPPWPGRQGAVTGECRDLLEATGSPTYSWRDPVNSPGLDGATAAGQAIYDRGPGGGHSDEMKAAD
ncbi:MAG: hypothetical protein M3O70_29025 [Actinomycetota bacterium]|nr:hypothetical protein [Actinomycetota bacterium]